MISAAERTPLVEALLAILDAQPQRLTQLEETVQQLRDEIAILKGQKPRPGSAPSRLETPPKPGTESIVRGYLKTRKISGSMRSAAGRRCRDTFARLQKTCRKLGVSFGAWVCARLRGLGRIPRLAELIRPRATEACSAVPEEAVLA